MIKPKLHNLVIQSHRRWLILGGAITFLSWGSVCVYYYYVYKVQCDYFKNYDAYKHYEIMCRAQLERGKVYMRTCPHELAKKWRDNGKPIAPLSASE